MDTQQGRVHDKVTLITGAASGMGESHARVLASQGAKVALADIADDKGTELAKDLNEKYGDGTAVLSTSMSPISIIGPRRWRKP